MRIKMWVIVGGGVTGFMLSGCGFLVSGEDVAKAVEKQGYSNVEVLEKHVVIPSWYGCGKDDSVAFKMRASNALGRRVDLTVCSGWLFKGVTIRTW